MSPAVAADMETLRALWADAKTQRERAEVEHLMWASVPPGERPKSGAAPWLATLLDVAVDQPKGRMSLHLAGPGAELLWARIDGPEKMLVRSASGILARAKVRVMEGISLEEAVARELAIYDTWAAHHCAGGTFRKPPARPRGFSRDADKAEKARHGVSADAWSGVRAAVKRMVDVELMDLADGEAKARIRGQMEVEISTLVEMLRARVSSAKRRSASAKVATDLVGKNGEQKYEKLEAACLSLSVDPPSRGEPMTHEVYMAAKKHFRALAREYHPDHGGSAAQYDEVVKAWRTVEEYHQEHATKG